MNYDKLAGNQPSGNSGQSNLKPWPKGVSGNPSGRPPKSLYQKEMEKKFNDPETVARMIAASVDTMCDGRLGVASVMERRNNQERVDGAIKTEVEITNVNAKSDEDLIKSALSKIMKLTA